MYDIPLKQVIDSSLSKIGSVADVNTVIGDPITTADGITIIPFSKVTVGFASGGADYDGKAPESEKPPHFIGGNGAGVSVVPLGFLVVDKDGVRMIDLQHDASFAPYPTDPVSKTVDAIMTVCDKTPEIIDKLKVLFNKKEASEKAPDTAE